MFQRIRRLERLLAGLALGAGVVAMSSPAWATLTGTGATYATQAVVNAGGVITIPVIPFVYTTPLSTGTAASAGSLTIVFTLPTGTTPTTAVTATVGTVGANCTASTVTGVVSTNTITFTVPTLAGGTTGACSLSLNAFTISGATVLQTTTKTGGFQITGALTAQSGTTFNLDPVPIPATNKTDLGLSKSGLAVTVVAAAAGTIDTSSGAINQGKAALGKVFGAAGTDSLAFGTGAGGSPLGTVATNTATGVVGADGVTAFSFGSVTANVTLTGNFSGIGTIFLDPLNVTCQNTTTTEAAVAGVIAGSISGSTATFTGVSLSATPATVCEYATGSSVIGANVSGVAVAATVSGSTATSTGGVTLAASTYTQGTPYYVTYSGNNNSYPTFLRVVNNSAAPIDVYADVQGDTGTVGSAIVVSKLAPFNNDLYFVGTIMSNAGVSGTNNFGRASLIIFAAPSNANIENGGNTAFGPGAVGISHLMLSPNGTVIQMGGNNSP